MKAFRIRLPSRLSAASIVTLDETLTEAEASENSVWVFEGAEPGVFCLGMDLASVATEAKARETVQAFGHCMGRLMNAPCPTIALIEGQALGGGLGLAAACDLTVATSESTVGLPEALFGILPAMIMPALLTRMTPQRTRLLALTGATQKAAWAEQAGLFDRVVEEARFERASRRAQKDLSRVAPVTVGRLRKLIHDQSVLPVGAGLDAAMEVAAEMVADPEVHKNVTRFLEEGVAPWSA